MNTHILLNPIWKTRSFPYITIKRDTGYHESPTIVNDFFTLKEYGKSPHGDESLYNFIKNLPINTNYDFADFNELLNATLNDNLYINDEFIMEFIIPGIGEIQIPFFHLHFAPGLNENEDETLHVDYIIIFPSRSIVFMELIKYPELFKNIHFNVYEWLLGTPFTTEINTPKIHPYNLNNEIIHSHDLI
jgi:hypothetical protein